MKKIFKHKSSIGILFLGMLLSSSMVVSAATSNFEGTLNYRVLDGSTNGKYYSFDANKTLTMSGSVTIYDTTNYIGTPNTVYILCYEKTLFGQGNKICDTSVTPAYDGQAHSFYATGTTTNTSDKYYIYCHKIEDDGFDLTIKGTLSTN